MKRLEIELHENIFDILTKLKNVDDSSIELSIPEGAVIFENAINLKLLKNWSDRESKVLQFETDDLNGQNLIVGLEEGAISQTEKSGEQLDTVEDLPEIIRKPRKRLNISVLKKGKGYLWILGIGFLLLLGFLGLRALSELPVAKVNLVVNSQPLTRSIQLRVTADGSTDKNAKTLAGITIQTQLEEIVTTETTGEKIVGEPAEGKVTIYNNTDKDIEFEQGTTLVFEDDDNDFEYITSSDVTVPKRTALDPDPLEPDITSYKKGSKDVSVEAAQIGPGHNIDSGEKLSVEDYKKSEVEAEVSEDIDGGKEETVKVVAQADMDKLTDDITKQADQKIGEALQKTASSGQKLLAGSEEKVVTKSTFSKELDDEAEDLSLNQTVSITGLTYNSKDLDSLIDDIVEEFVPEGFVVSTKERVLNVEVLGNTTDTVLTSKTADIQVTLKTFVVPGITEDIVKDNIVDKSLTDAEKYLGSVKNVNSYELRLDPKVPFFTNIPKDKNRIVVTLERE